MENLLRVLKIKISVHDLTNHGLNILTSHGVCILCFIIMGSLMAVTVRSAAPLSLPFLGALICMALLGIVANRLYSFTKDMEKYDACYYSHPPRMTEVTRSRYIIATYIFTCNVIVPGVFLFYRFYSWLK